MAKTICILPLHLCCILALCRNHPHQLIHRSARIPIDLALVVRLPYQSYRRCSTTRRLDCRRNYQCTNHRLTTTFVLSWRPSGWQRGSYRHLEHILARLNRAGNCRRRRLSTNYHLKKHQSNNLHPRQKTLLREMAFLCLLRRRRFESILPHTSPMSFEYIVLSNYTLYSVRIYLEVSKIWHGS